MGQGISLLALLVFGESRNERGFITGTVSLFERPGKRGRDSITHEVNPRFLSSFFKSATVSLSQFLERRTVETNERLLVFTALDKGLVAGRNAVNMLNPEVTGEKPEDSGRGNT